MEDVAYWDPSIQPSNDLSLGSLLADHYGRLDAPTIHRDPMKRSITFIRDLAWLHCSTNLRLVDYLPMVTDRP